MSGQRPRASEAGIATFIMVCMIYIFTLFSLLETRKTLRSICEKTEATCDGISREQPTP